MSQAPWWTWRHPGITVAGAGSVQPSVPAGVPGLTSAGALIAWGGYAYKDGGGSGGTSVLRIADAKTDGMTGIHLAAWKTGDGQYICSPSWQLTAADGQKTSIYNNRLEDLQKVAQPAGAAPTVAEALAKCRDIGLAVLLEYGPSSSTFAPTAQALADEKVFWEWADGQPAVWTPLAWHDAARGRAQAYAGRPYVYGLSGTAPAAPADGTRRAGDLYDWATGKQPGLAAAMAAAAAAGATFIMGNLATADLADAAANAFKQAGGRPAATPAAVYTKAVAQAWRAAK